VRLIKFESPRLFLDKVGEFLEQNEAVNNLLLGILSRMSKWELKGNEIRDTFMCFVEDTDGHIIVVILLNNRNLIIYGEGTGYEEAINIAAFEIFRLGLQVPGVVGPTDIAREFAIKWASLSKSEAYEKMQQKIYILNRVNAISYSSGHLRMADNNDLPLISQWIYEFTNSMSEQITQEESMTKAQECIGDSSLFLWENEFPVCMVKKARPTKTGIVITYVYTPPLHRNIGYATSCVASLSQLMLNEGKLFCSLYTDLSNPTSNHIYSNIGYHPIQDSIMYRFK
jgi:predicted GNAT family acetyltransferase